MLSKAANHMELGGNHYKDNFHILPTGNESDNNKCTYTNSKQMVA